MYVLLMTETFFLLFRWPGRRAGEAPPRRADVRVRGRAGDVGDAAALGEDDGRSAAAQGLRPDSARVARPPPPPLH